MVEGNHMVYRISAPTPEEKDEWIHSIKYVKAQAKVASHGRRRSPPCHVYRSAVSVDPFYEMLAARKKRISLKKKEEQP